MLKQFFVELASVRTEGAEILTRAKKVQGAVEMIWDNLLSERCHTGHTGELRGHGCATSEAGASKNRSVQAVLQPK